MTTLETMLRSHPRGERLHISDYVDALGALALCAETCTICADACLAESGHVERLRRCITTDLDCAEVCSTTRRVLLRQTDSPTELIHAQLHACVVACQLCAEACEEHAGMHDHCRLCAETCRACQERCNFLVGETSSAGVASGAIS